LFFEKDILSLRILDVVELKQEKISRHVSGRAFHALSFRLRSDVRLHSCTQDFLVQDDTVTFLPAGLKYSRTGTHDELIAVHFHMADVTEKQIEVFQPENPAELREMFSSLLTCWKERKQGYRYQCTAIFYGILAHCHCQMAQERTENRISASVDHLEQNWSNPDLTMGEIAERSFMSEVYFRRLFKQQFGISPQKYLIRLRVEKAADLWYNTLFGAA